MENKIILVTGANGGLGSSFVKELLKNNPSKIYCAARDITTLKELERLDQRIQSISLDITNDESIKDAISKIDNLDILINNAGVNTNSRLFSDDSFLDIEVNLKGTAKLTQALFDKLKESKGKIINVSSVLALVNLPMLGNYCVSKSALHSFTQALRAEFALFEGEVYEVLPGPIETRMTEGSPMPKTKPQDIVKAVIESVNNKEFEIFPDDFSKMVNQRLQNDKEKLLEEFNCSIN